MCSLAPLNTIVATAALGDAVTAFVTALLSAAFGASISASVAASVDAKVAAATVAASVYAAVSAAMAFPVARLTFVTLVAFVAVAFVVATTSATAGFSDEQKGQ